MSRIPSIIEVLNTRHAYEFSSKAHHSGGLDYLCLLRTGRLTLKAYFFDEGSEDDLVVPHTHRYDFDTRIIAGSVCEARFGLVDSGNTRQACQQYAYDADAEGDRFTAGDLCILREWSDTKYVAGQTYSNRAHFDIHTLRKVTPGTILLITQYADVGSSTTLAWSRTGTPKTDGLYQPMSQEDVLARVGQLHEAMGGESP